MKPTDTKNLIILHVLKHMQNPSVEHARTAKILLLEMAKQYGCTVKKQPKTGDLLARLIEFVGNEAGYIRTIGNLSNEL
jgi:hypothetical protein